MFSAQIDVAIRDNAQRLFTTQLSTLGNGKLLLPFCDKSLRVASSCHSNFPESFFLLTCSLALLEMELITTMLPHYCFLLHLSADLDVEKIKELRTIQLKVKLSDEVRL